MRLLWGALGRLAAAAAFALALPASAFGEIPVRTVASGNAGEISQLSGDRIVHRQAEFTFPAKLDRIPAAEAVVYGPGDVSVEYSTTGRFGAEPWLTFYVYPAKAELALDADVVEQIIVEQWAAQPLAEAPAMPASMRGGRGGWYTARRDGQEFITGYGLVLRGKWFLKARFTMPKEAGTEGMNRVAAALAALPWDWTPTN